MELLLSQSNLTIRPESKRPDRLDERLFDVAETAYRIIRLLELTCFNAFLKPVSTFYDTYFMLDSGSPTDITLDMQKVLHIGLDRRGLTLQSLVS